MVMVPPKVIEITKFFDLVLVYNRGASFGIFSNSPDWVSFALIVFAILISIALAIWMWHADGNLLAFALALVAGGAVGNVIDRIRLGAVVDFLDLHVGGWHWPAFNIAIAGIIVINIPENNFATSTIGNQVKPLDSLILLSVSFKLKNVIINNRISLIKF